MKIIHIVIIASIVLGYAYMHFVLGMGIEDILAYLPDSYLLIAAVILALYCIKGVVMVIPITVLYIAAGAIFPIGWAILLSCVGLFCEATVGYLNGKRLGGEKIVAMIEKNKRLSKYLSKQDNSDVTSCFLLRIIPMQFDVISMFFGAARMRFAQFIFFTLLGSFTGLVPFVMLGDTITSPISVQFIVLFAICTSISITTFLVYRKMQARKGKAGDNETKQHG